MREEIEVLYSEEEIEKKIIELAARIDAVYQNQPLHLVCILKGAEQLRQQYGELGRC